MSKKEGSSSGKKRARVQISQLADDLIERYLKLKKEGFTEGQIQTTIKIDINPIDIPDLRLNLENWISSDTRTIASFEESIAVNLKEHWSLNLRIEQVHGTLIGVTNEDELKMLSKMTDYNEIKETLSKHRTACMILQKNLIRCDPKNLAREKILQMLNDAMPKIKPLGLEDEV